VTSPLRNITLAWAFCLTGVGTALLGATLPAILHEWRLNDSHGGLILFAAWAGSTLGALFARGVSGRTGIVGLLLSGGELFWLSLGGTHSPAFAFFLYGLGLGTTMTAISLCRASEVSPTDTDLELNRLNLIWAIGACFAPALALHSLKLLTVTQIFRVLSFVFLISAAALSFALLCRRSTQIRAGGTKSHADLPWAPVGLCLVAAVAVGLESALGGWLTTYAARFQFGLTAAISANSFFWAGLLFSRGLHSIPTLRFLHTNGARVGHIAATGLALVLLTAFPNRWLLPTAGLLAGFGLGPLYPLALSVALPRYRSTAVFVSAGLGASTLPWITGALSTHYDSLRIGLLACCAAFLLLAGTARQFRTNLTDVT
jgi:MFS transporter, FHS family, glucose/mannose:H+ symporter